MNNLPCLKWMVLKNDILIATCRKHGHTHEKFKSTSQPVLAKIKLHLSSIRQFRYFRIGPYFLLQPHLICLNKITYVVAQGLLIARKSAVSLFQIIIHRGHIKLSKFILLIHFQDIFLTFFQHLIPKHMLLPERSEVPLIHSIILGHSFVI
ncbi:hypothetical protein ES703_125510 [subsurface metagenome]